MSLFTVLITVASADESRLAPSDLGATGSGVPGASPNAGAASVPAAGQAAGASVTSSNATTSKLSALLTSGTFSAADLDAIWLVRNRLHGSLTEFARSTPEIPDQFQVLFRIAQLLSYVGHFVLVKAPPETRSDTFLLGAQIAQRAIELEPGRVEGHYWFAVAMAGHVMNEGLFLSVIEAPRILSALDQAVSILPEYFFSGPLRARGRLLLKMPGFPFSVGDNKQALIDLRRAVEKSPEVKMNSLFLAEALVEMGLTDQAKEVLLRAKSLSDLIGPVEESFATKRLADLERLLK